MSKTATALGFGALALYLAFSPSTATAAQQRFAAAQQLLLQHLQTTLPEHGVTVLNQSATDRFALVYAKHDQGSAVTLTLRQLPQQQDNIDLSIVTDSPRDRQLEQRLMQAVSRAISNPADS
jgi:hypothetical protein